MICGTICLVAGPLAVTELILPELQFWGGTWTLNQGVCPLSPIADVQKPLELLK
jgi:hypothetical protein